LAPKSGDFGLQLEGDVGKCRGMDNVN
jgi:hypothetical protein